MFTHLDVNDAKSVENLKLLSDYYEFRISEVWEQNASANLALERGFNVERQSLYRLQLAIVEQKTSLDIKTIRSTVLSSPKTRG